MLSLKITQALDQVEKYKDDYDDLSRRAALLAARRGRLSADIQEAGLKVRDFRHEMQLVPPALVKHAAALPREPVDDTPVPVKREIFWWETD